MALEDTEKLLGEQRIEDVYRALDAHIPDTGPSKAATRNAAVAMVISEQGDRGLSALFIQRAEHPNDPWSGQMALPGGRSEPCDPSLDAAARRETREEVGLELTEEMLIGRLSDISGGRLSMHGLAVSPFVFHHPGPAGLTPNYEVAATVWVPLSHLGDPANIQPYVFPRDPEQREFPSWQYEGYTIWGLTYRIIGNYLRLFGVEIPGEVDVTDVE
ncbi:MAG: CoA pyrophosphatase [Candidatus Hydrogenedentes bacterium]|nr:CoA pyrophosphatase [Candidatus Hydrogenedentota bacterium]